MRPIEVGLVLPMLADPLSGRTHSWETIKRRTEVAEALGFDTVWVADELVWEVPDWPGPRGWWECVAMLGAVAAASSKIKIGSWVLSALHRNPGLTAKVAETIDEVSGGRFILGFGSGHSGRQGESFGYPPDRTVGRYEEALKIVSGLLREGEADFAGKYHSAKRQILTPRGPRPGRIPLMLGGHGPRTMALAVEYGDIWSAYAVESSLPGAFADLIQKVNQICEENGRDPESLGKSVGVFVEPTNERIVESIGFGVPLTGTPAQLADEIHQLSEMGFTRVELVPYPDNDRAIEALGEMLHMLDT